MDWIYYFALFVITPLSIFLSWYYFKDRDVKPDKAFLKGALIGLILLGVISGIVALDTYVIPGDDYIFTWISSTILFPIYLSYLVAITKGVKEGWERKRIAKEEYLKANKNNKK